MEASVTYSEDFEASESVQQAEEAASPQSQHEDGHPSNAEGDNEQVPVAAVDTELAKHRNSKTPNGRAKSPPTSLTSPYCAPPKQSKTAAKPQRKPVFGATPYVRPQVQDRPVRVHVEQFPPPRVEKKESDSFDLRFYKAADPVREYDIMSDVHSQHFLQSKHFERHWKAVMELPDPRHRIDSMILEATRARADRMLRLPSVMQRPVETLKKQFEGRVQARAVEEPHALVRNFNVPYLTLGETDVMIDKFLKKGKHTESPEETPITRPKLVASPSRTDSRDSRNRLSPNTRNRDLNSNQDLFPSRQPVISMGLLTDQYLTILARSEDYARRQDIATEETKRANLVRNFKEKLAFYEERFSVHIHLFDAERNARKDVADDEELCWFKLGSASVKDRIASISREEIFASCPMLNPNCATSVETSTSSSIIVDLRYTGLPESITLYVLAFDENYKFVAYCCTGDSLHCSETGNTVVRSWGDTRFGGTPSRKDQEQGQRATFEFLLPNLTIACPLRRFVFCVMNGKRTGATLLDMFRAYLTVRVPEHAAKSKTVKLQSDTRMREAMAIRLPDNVPESALVIGSIIYSPEVVSAPSLRHKTKLSASMRGMQVRVKSEVGFITHLRAFPNVLSYLRLPPLLESAMLLTEKGVLAEYCAGCYRVQRQEQEASEKIYRQAMLLHESAGWEDIIVCESQKVNALREELSVANQNMSSMYVKFYGSSARNPPKKKGAARRDSKLSSLRKTSSGGDPFMSRKTSIIVDLGGTSSGMESSMICEAPDDFLDPPKRQLPRRRKTSAASPEQPANSMRKRLSVVSPPVEEPSNSMRKRLSVVSPPVEEPPNSMRRRVSIADDPLNSSRKRVSLSGTR